MRPWRIVLRALATVVLIGPLFIDRGGLLRWFLLLMGQYVVVDAVLLWTHRGASRRTRRIAMIIGTLGLVLILGWAAGPGTMRLSTSVGGAPASPLFLFAFVLLRAAAVKALREPPAVDPDVFA